MELEQTEYFRNWFLSLKDQKVTTAITKRLYRLSLGAYGDHRYLGDGVSELRLHLRSGYRIYYSQVGSVVLLLINGSSKRRQEHHISQAKRILREWKIENG